MNDREHVVKVVGWSAEFNKGRDGRELLRIRITAEVDGVEGDYAITYSRHGDNRTVGHAYARGDAPGGRKADAERFAAVVKALTGREPKVYRMKNGKNKDRMLRGTSGGLRPLRRARRRHREMAGGGEGQIEDDR